MKKILITLKDEIENKFRYIVKTKGTKTRWSTIPKSQEIIEEAIKDLYEKYKEINENKKNDRIL